MLSLTCLGAIGFFTARRLPRQYRQWAVLPALIAAAALAGGVGTGLTPAQWAMLAAVCLTATSGVQLAGIVLLNRRFARESPEQWKRDLWPAEFVELISARRVLVENGFLLAIPIGVLLFTVLASH